MKPYYGCFSFWEFFPLTSPLPISTLQDQPFLLYFVFFFFFLLCFKHCLFLHTGSRFLPSNLGLRIQRRFSVIFSQMSPILGKKATPTPPQNPAAQLTLDCFAPKERDGVAQPSRPSWAQSETEKGHQKDRSKCLLSWLSQVGWTEDEWKGQD